MSTIRPEVTGRSFGATAVEAERSDGPPGEADSEEPDEADPEELEPSPLEGAAASPQHMRQQVRAPPTFALTIPEFCKSHGISEAFYYELQKDGRGPRTMRVGRRRLVSIEEARRWRAAQTVEAKDSAA